MSSPIGATASGGRWWGCIWGAAGKKVTQPCPEPFEESLAASLARGRRE